MASCTVAAASISKGTIPHTILHAVEACRTEKRRRDDAPIDLLAVVVNVEQTDTLGRLWIHDASLPQGQSAQILLLGKTKRDMVVDELEIRPGDVIRFNRIDLRNDDDRTPNVFVFWHSFQDPEAGVEFFRLCHVDGFTGRVDTSPEISIPDSMQTNQGSLDELISWYRSSNLFVQSTTLPPLPCQYRPLAALQSCLGVVGHVVAHVLQVEICAHIEKRRKRRKAPTAVEPTSTIFATLTDDNGATMMTFYLDNSSSDHQKFQAVLQQAENEKRPVRLSRVVTKSASRLRATLRTDDILLVPTSETDVAFAENEDKVQYLSRKKNGSTKSQDYMAMADLARNNKEILHILSPILDITVKRVSLARQQKEYLNLDETSLSLNGLFRAEERNDEGVSYSSATITLRDPDLGEVHAEADGSILQILCGGLELSEWSPSRSICEPAVTPTAYHQLVRDMIRGLLTENVKLRWVIERIVVDRNVKSRYRVLDVSLPEL
jgi:hypothetical protein